MSEPTHTRAAISAVCVALLLTIAAPPARAATPISACGTVIKTPGSYVLTKNLTIKAGAKLDACVAVNASFVTIDLAGFVIDCGCGANTVGCPAGVWDENTSQMGIIVRNGTVSHCNAGVSFFFQSTGVLIDGISSLANVNAGVALHSGDSATRSIGNDNGGDGIPVSVCDLTSATDNTALGNGLGGVVDFFGSPCPALNNLSQ